MWKKAVVAECYVLHDSFLGGLIKAQQTFKKK
jgi:hypothetical protein